jgi:hypothetical protein
LGSRSDSPPGLVDFFYSISIARALELAIPDLIGDEQALKSTYFNIAVRAPIRDDRKGEPVPPRLHADLDLAKNWKNEVTS